MVTYVQEDIYPGHDAIDKYPHNGDQENYFPTVKDYASIKFGSIDIDPKTRDYRFFIDEIKVQFNTVKINDDPFEYEDPRITSFLTLKWDRDLIENIYGGYDVTDSGS